MPAGDYKQLASVILKNYQRKELLSKMGENAREAFVREFTLQAGIKHFENLINS